MLRSSSMLQTHKSQNHNQYVEESVSSWSRMRVQRSTSHLTITASFMHKLCHLSSPLTW